MFVVDGVQECAAAMRAAQRQLETAAENLANVETDNFRKHVERAGARGGAQLADGRGPLRPTGRTLDLALAGPGTLLVAPRVGERWSQEAAVGVRSASFARAGDGTLVDERGRALLGIDGAPVRIAEGAEIRTDGRFVKDGATSARIAVARGAELRSGFVEGSNVNPIGEMIEILDAQRSFETAQKSLTAIDNARGKATTDVGKPQ